jgi:hypothetical protein
LSWAREQGRGTCQPGSGTRRSSNQIPPGTGLRDYVISVFFTKHVHADISLKRKKIKKKLLKIREKNKKKPLKITKSKAFVLICSN